MQLLPRGRFAPAIIALTVTLASSLGSERHPYSNLVSGTKSYFFLKLAPWLNEELYAQKMREMDFSYSTCGDLPTLKDQVESLNLGPL
jgi:hypothetical protein